MGDLFECKSAVLSECGRYRYRLERVWEPGKPRACFVMLNPSTADAVEDDPTIRRCMGFARLWSCGGLVVVNLFAFRATDPDALKVATDPVGWPANDQHIQEAAAAASLVVAAWGANSMALGRSRQVLPLLGKDVRCLGLTQKGYPRHPLYVSGSQPLVPYMMS